MAENALWCAVIVEAIRDLGDRGQGTRDAARRWMYSGEHGVGSFEWICSNLDLDANKLRSISMSRHGRRELLKNKAKLDDQQE